MGCSPTSRPSRAGEFSLRVFFILWQCGPVAMCVIPPAPTMPSAVIHPDPLPHPIRGVVMHRVEQSGGNGLRIDIAPAARPTDDHATEKRWTDMLAANPRLYSGPLLAVVSIDFEEGVIHTRRDEFKRLAVQPQVKTGVQILSVTGVLTARDAQGGEHVLLGRRGRGTRIYGGMWELGPSGGLTPPAALTTTLDERDAQRQVLEEAEEELGLHLKVALPSVLYVRDTIACSDDLVIPLRHEDAGSLERLDAALKQQRATHAWEYEETRWVPIDPAHPEGLAQFDAKVAHEIIITSRAAFRGLGWVR